MGSAINSSVLGLTKAMANALGPKGVTVNVVNPGFMATRRWDELIERTARERNIDSEAAREWLLEMVPLRKVVDPADVADLVAFLASDRAASITGVSINIDGGRSRSL
jgi:NAD(P)-dependent dehydrogenase (short-subunit alcohol dehydrogenase family)